MSSPTACECRCCGAALTPRLSPMRNLEPTSASPSVRRWTLGLLAGGLILLSLWVLAPFLAPIAWAAIIAYVSWPAYLRVRKPLARSATVAALGMVLLLTCVLLIPLLWLLVLLRNELVGSFGPIAASLTEGAHVLGASLERIPWLKDLLQRQFNRYLADPAAFGREWTSLLQTWLGTLATLLGELGRNVVKILLTLLLLFFAYRDGDRITGELGRAGRRLLGPRYLRYVSTAGAITRAVFAGFILSAAAQGLIAGIGYRLVGLPAPVLLGALTGVLSVIPLIGTALAWLPIAIGLMAIGAWGKGLFLLALGHPPRPPDRQSAAASAREQCRETSLPPGRARGDRRHDRLRSRWSVRGPGSARARHGAVAAVGGRLGGTVGWGLILSAERAGSG